MKDATGAAEGAGSARRETGRVTREGGSGPEPVVKSLLAGRIAEDTLFPYPEIPQETRETVGAFLDSFRSFARDHIDPARIERDHRIDPDVIRGLAELGAFGMTIRRHTADTGSRRPRTAGSRRRSGRSTPRSASSSAATSRSE